MILTLDQIKDIVINNPNRVIIAKAAKYTKQLQTHLYGTDLKAALPTVEGFEKEALRETRVKYTKSNKDLCSRILRPVDKVFSAKGGSVYYNLANTQDKAARAISMNIRNGLSVKEWVEQIWKTHFIDDPNGIVFMEVSPMLQTYPTYKSISCIHDYQTAGNKLEYIVFTVSESEKKAQGINETERIFRVVDDAFDYYVKVVGTNITILEDHTFPNVFGYVPAILNSDIISPDGSMYLSILDDVIETATQFMVKGSIKVTHDFMHGFPKYWEYADDCMDCNGTQMVDGKSCTTCKGTGKNIMTKVSDAKLMAYPQSKEDPIVTPNVAGYVEPSKIYYEIATADLSALEDVMYYTLWGSMPKTKINQGMQNNKEGQKTATEVMGDMQPLNERLMAISAMAEKRHKFILDCAIKLQVSPDYKGASVNYGKRFMLESADQLLENYQNAKLKGLSVSVLDDLLVEYLEGKYGNDPVSLNVNLKLKDVEPFPHYTIQQVQTFNIDPVELNKKIYFGEWLRVTNEAVLMTTDVATLRDMLAEYTSTKNIPTPENVSMN